MWRTTAGLDAACITQDVTTALGEKRKKLRIGQISYSKLRLRRVGEGVTNMLSCALHELYTFVSVCVTSVMRGALPCTARLPSSCTLGLG